MLSPLQELEGAVIRLNPWTGLECLVFGGGVQLSPVLQAEGN